MHLGIFADHIKLQQVAIMPIIDFKEIPQANTGNGDQDTFELFARQPKQGFFLVCSCTTLINFSA